MFVEMGFCAWLFNFSCTEQGCLTLGSSSVAMPAAGCSRAVQAARQCGHLPSWAILVAHSPLLLITEGVGGGKKDFPLRRCSLCSLQSLSCQQQWMANVV